MDTLEVLLCAGGVLALAYFAFSKYFSNVQQHTAQIPPQPKRRHLDEKRDFYASELSAYDGSDPLSPILMGVNGKVYDVTSGSKFYGPGGPYHPFAGKDASLYLAKGIVQLDEDTKDQALTKDEIESLEEWARHYEMKYEYVGKLLDEKEKTN